MNIIPNKKTRFQDLGLVDYQTAWDYQTALFEEIIERKINNRKGNDLDYTPTPNYLLFCQHPHVYTLGKSGKADHLLLDEAGLKNLNAKFYHINRGGDITYHGPGQLVGYPILDLENFFTDIHKYLRMLEEAVILTLQEFGIEAGRIEGLTGVWIDHERQIQPRKICAMGVKSSRWVTMHGFAFNINTDLRYFNHIVPCGIDDKAVTSLQAELGEPQDMALVAQKMRHHLQQLFGIKLIHLQPEAVQ